MGAGFFIFLSFSFILSFFDFISLRGGDGGLLLYMSGMEFYLFS